MDRQDVGGATPAGSSTYGAGTFTVKGGGGDIWGTADQFNYVSQPSGGDLSVVARVTSQTATDPWAKAGVMIKQSATAGAPYALVAVTPATGSCSSGALTTGQRHGQLQLARRLGSVGSPGQRLHRLRLDRRVQLG